MAGDKNVPVKYFKHPSCVKLLANTKTILCAWRNVPPSSRKYVDGLSQQNRMQSTLKSTADTVLETFTCDVEFIKPFFACK